MTNRVRAGKIRSIRSDRLLYIKMFRLLQLATVAVTAIGLVSGECYEYADGTQCRSTNDQNGTVGIGSICYLYVVDFIQKTTPEVVWCYVTKEQATYLPVKAWQISLPPPPLWHSQHHIPAFSPIPAKQIKTPEPPSRSPESLTVFNSQLKCYNVTLLRDETHLGATSVPSLHNSMCSSA